ncbi:MAG TPA: serine/threonine-protein kinase [Gemmatimonadales bacterium]|nr:serine/threonine-protein kinase [Gemmatimonadales bacterium]
MAAIEDRLNAALAGRYTIERELGAGGMATVYLATDARHDRKVALKVLKPDLAAVLGPDRFPREIRIVAQFHHPHILSLYDSGESAGFLYYVMPLVEGESLRQRMRRERQMPVGDVVRILRQIVDALAYAHQRGIVHRDIKPDNVMLEGRHAVVTDFGVAKAVTAAGGEKLTTVGVAVGTPTYMSPEQAMGQVSVDHRSDLYAVGVLGYEMLTGTPPFDGPTAQAILSAHVLEEPPHLRDMRPAVPPVLAEALRKCLAKDPADRWPSAEELLARLELVGTTPSGGVTPTDTRPVQVTAARRAVRRRSWIAGIVAVVVLVGGGVSGWLLGVGRGGDGRIQRIAVLPIEDISGRDAVFVDAIHASLTSALSGLGTVGVAPRSTMMFYRSAERPTREIARELQLDGVVEITVFRAGEIMRMNAQFVDPRTTRAFWSDTYERNVSDVLAAQNDIVARIAAGVGGVLGVTEPGTGGGRR